MHGGCCRHAFLRVCSFCGCRRKSYGVFVAGTWRLLPLWQTYIGNQGWLRVWQTYIGECTKKQRTSVS
jgi:hypothetical protein